MGEAGGGDFSCPLPVWLYLPARDGGPKRGVGSGEGGGRGGIKLHLMCRARMQF